MSPLYGDYAAHRLKLDDQLIAWTRKSMITDPAVLRRDMDRRLHVAITPAYAAYLIEEAQDGAV
jgi:hypothetical protein